MTLLDIKRQYRDSVDIAELEYRSVTASTNYLEQARLLEKWLQNKADYKEFCRDNGLCYDYES